MAFNQFHASQNTTVKTVTHQLIYICKAATQTCLGSCKLPKKEVL
jgi:hypothetical protein